MLGSLKARRAEVLTNSTIDLRVPRWDNPEMFVRFKPVSHALLKKATRVGLNAAERKRDEAEVEANCDVLIDGCVGVFARLDGKDYSLRPGDEDGEPTLFDEDLAENLGCGKTARAVVRALYITDGDIISTASRISEFSGYKDAETMDALTGE